MRTPFLPLSRVLFVGLVYVSLAFSQMNSAGISGNVLDASGANVANASVEADSLETGGRRITASGASGVYSLTALRIGHYRVVIQAPGFQAFTLNDVQLQVGQTLTLDAHLKIQSAVTAVDVQDASAPLDQISATIGGVVSGEQVRQLPINGRSWASLMTQTPGAIDSRCRQPAKHSFRWARARRQQNRSIALRSSVCVCLHPV